MNNIEDITKYGATVIFNPPPPPTSTTPPVSSITTVEVVGPLLTITRIQSIGELIAKNLDIQKIYFTNNGLTQTDYEAFLQANGVIITFTDSLGTNYIVPSTYVNWPPVQNGYPYQVMGTNIALGPFMAELDLTSQMDYLSGVIEEITGITPSLNLVELSDIYPIDKSAATVIETMRDNVVDGPGTPAYYSAMFDYIQNEISEMLPGLNLTGVNYGNLIPNADVPILSSLPDDVLG